MNPFESAGLRYVGTLLLCVIVLLLVSCGNPGDQHSSAEADEVRLLKVAMVNMRSLQSYHVEIESYQFDPGAQSDSFDLATVGAWPFYWPFTMTVDVRPQSNDLVLSWRSRLGVTLAYITTNGQQYQSEDDGNTWSLRETDSGAGYLVDLFVNIWDVSATNRLDEDLGKTLEVVVSDPVFEQVDGVNTRRLVTKVQNASVPDDAFVGRYSRLGVKTITFWVADDGVPRIHQMEMEGSSDLSSTNTPQGSEFTPSSWAVGENRPKTASLLNLDKASQLRVFRYRWKWSRFNEDLSEIKPPPTETIKSP